MPKKIIIICLAFIVPVLMFSQVILVKIDKQNEESRLIISNTIPIANSTSNNQGSLFDIVVGICKSVEREDINDLENWVVEVPDIYIHKSGEEMRKYLKMDSKTFAEVTKKRKDKLTAISYPVSATKEELVHNAISAIGTIQKANEKFIEIVDLKQNENQAKATVKFESNKLGVTNYEILMIKIDSNWKVFRFTYPERWSHSYAEKILNN